jgi:hypothetical protein
MRAFAKLVFGSKMEIDHGKRSQLDIEAPRPAFVNHVDASSRSSHCSPASHAKTWFTNACFQIPMFLLLLS